jgi:hypothetical protein
LGKRLKRRVRGYWMIAADKYCLYIFLIKASLVKSPEHIGLMRVVADCVIKKCYNNTAFFIGKMDVL